MRVISTGRRVPVTRRSQHEIPLEPRSCQRAWYDGGARHGNGVSETNLHRVAARWKGNDKSNFDIFLPHILNSWIDFRYLATWSRCVCDLLDLHWTAAWLRLYGNSWRILVRRRWYPTNVNGWRKKHRHIATSPHRHRHVCHVLLLVLRP